jgi:NAD(P)-dependent dehydrogenase (short-subunit alcohol dehydrogenase family)
MITLICAALSGGMFYLAYGLDDVLQLAWIAPVPLLWLVVIFSRGPVLAVHVGTTEAFAPNPMRSVMRLIVAGLCGMIATASFAGAETAEHKPSKAVLVTGASSGIGRKITERLAANGYFVYATARKDEDLKALGAIPNVQSLRLDVTKPADIAAALETITKGGRGLYGLVNNAGVGTYGTIADMSVEEFDLSMKVNVYGPVMMIKAFQPLVIAEHGRIVNIGSLSGVLASSKIPAYVMSKHAIEGLTDSLAVLLAPLGVQVSVVEPGNYKGNIDQNMLARLPEDEKAKVAKALGPNLDASQLPEPDEVAAAVEQALFESSPKRRYVVSAQPALVEKSIRKQFEQLVQLNEGQPYTYDRAELVKMLDEALVGSRPRTPPAATRSSQ